MNLFFFPLYPQLKVLIHYIRKKIFRIKSQIQEKGASLKSTGYRHLKVNVISIQAGEAALNKHDFMSFNS